MYSTTNPPTTKTCANGDKCVHPQGPILPATSEYFYITKSGSPRKYCKECAKAYRRQYHEDNREHENARSLQYVDQHREKVNTYNRTYNKAHHEEVKEWQRLRYQRRADVREKKRRYYWEHRDVMLEANKRWARKNKEQRKVITNRRRARIKQSKSSFTASDVQKIYEMQRGKCWWCGKSVGDDYHVDHRIPLAKKGSNGADNIVISCPDCNRRKNANMPWEFNGRLL